MSVSSMVKMGLVVGAMAVLTGCQDPITAMMVKKNESDWKDINSVVLYDPITIGTKPNNGTNVRVSNKMFVELSNPERIVATSSDLSISVLPFDGFDSSIISSEIEKKLKENGFSINKNGLPVTIKINNVSDKYAATKGDVHALGGIGSIVGGLGATVAQSVATEAAGAIVSSRSGENGIARGINYTISYGNEQRNIKLDHIDGTDLSVNNPDMIKIRDTNLFIAMIAKSTSELITK